MYLVVYEERYGKRGERTVWNYYPVPWGTDVPDTGVKLDMALYEARRHRNRGRRAYIVPFEARGARRHSSGND